MQALHYAVGSAFYFERQAVVAAGLTSAASRTAFFAAVNGCSAAVILAVQVPIITPSPLSFSIPSLSQSHTSSCADDEGELQWEFAHTLHRMPSRPRLTRPTQFLLHKTQSWHHGKTYFDQNTSPGEYESLPHKSFVAFSDGSFAVSSLRGAVQRLKRFVVAGAADWASAAPAVARSGTGSAPSDGGRTADGHRRSPLTGCGRCLRNSSQGTLSPGFKS